MSGFGLVSRLDTTSSVLRERLDMYSNQMSTGRKGDLYGDIAPSARKSISLRADITRREGWVATVDRALGHTSVVQTTLDRIHGIADEFYAESIKVDGLSAQRITTVAAQAKAALLEIAHLLNEKHNGEYIFGGTDTANPPIPDPDNIINSGLVQDIFAAIGGLAVGNSATVAAATNTAATSDAAGTTPFSAFLSDPAAGLTEPRRSVPAAEGLSVQYGIFANRNTQATSAGDTTGSWARDIFRGLATLAALDPSQPQLGQDFNDIVGTARDSLRSAVDAISVERGGLGSTEAHLAGLKLRHEDISIILVEQVANIEEVDMAEVLARVQATETQLEASYRAIGLVSSLTLTNFL